MKNILYIVGGIILLAAIAGGGYYLYRYYSQSNTDQTIIGNDQQLDDNNQNTTGTNTTIVRSDFTENFRDGKIDDWWEWNNANNDQNAMNVDYVKEELSMTAAASTSQWTSDDTAPTLGFLTDQDFLVEAKYIFDPRVDYQHGGVGLFDTNTKEWIRFSRSYDTHALQGQYDIANNLYVMEKRIGEGIIKYNHANFLDSVVYMRMQRKGNDVSFSYSRDGVKWEELDHVTKENLSKEVEVYLFAYSTASTPAKIVFKNISFSVLD
ncbi:MAG TPA: DUF1349 domain-containing protein [bacterium]|nr:DUF1349 domain-containing protein [bacterium]